MSESNSSQRAIQVHPHLLKVDVKMLQEIGQKLDGSTG